MVNEKSPNTEEKDVTLVKCVRNILYYFIFSSRCFYQTF